MLLSRDGHCGRCRVVYRANTGFRCKLLHSDGAKTAHRCQSPLIHLVGFSLSTASSSCRGQGYAGGRRGSVQRVAASQYIAATGECGALSVGAASSLLGRRVCLCVHGGVTTEQLDVHCQVERHCWSRPWPPALCCPPFPTQPLLMPVHLQTGLMSEPHAALNASSSP